VQGFQWIDGSFVEDIERTERRKPNDIDIVTFHYVPYGHTEESFYHEFQDLFDEESIASKYAVHAHYVYLGSDQIEFVIENCTYWYSLWSHRRDRIWKGYLQLGLANDDDNAARREIDRLASEGGQV